MQYKTEKQVTWPIMLLFYQKPTSTFSTCLTLATYSSFLMQNEKLWSIYLKVA